MAKQTKKASAKGSELKQKKVEKVPKYGGDLLQGKYDEVYLKRNGLFKRTIQRKARFWCYKIHFAVVQNRTIPDCPKGFKEYIEKLPGFAGWKYFAHTWDVTGTNPFSIVLRLQSVWDDWDVVMNRVAIPIDSPPEQIQARMQALEDMYARKIQKGQR